MPSIWKALLKLAADVALTIGFFYAGMMSAPFASGFIGSGLTYASSFIPGMGGVVWPSGQSLPHATLLYWLAATYLLLPFAIGIEVLRRLVGRAPAWLYAAGAIAVFASHIRLDGGVSPADALAVAIMLLAAAVGGVAYWLVTIRSREIVTILLRRVLCGGEA